MTQLFDPLRDFFSAAGEFLRRTALLFCEKGLWTLSGWSARLQSAERPIETAADMRRYAREGLGGDRYSRQTGIRD